VFDGPNKPPFKRNQKTNVKLTEHWETTQMKSLIRAFGFAWWDAPGEAEAECALLQREGLVDIIITEDVDSLMFGASKVAREIPQKTRTHVNLYSSVEVKTGLDRDGMILIAMASGGDYLPAGIKNCGPMIAAEVVQSMLLLTVDGSSRLWYHFASEHRSQKMERRPGR
jgi:holliday junction resolvase YEN1